MRRSSCSAADYARSQAAVQLPGAPPPAAAALVISLLASEGRLERERLGIALLEALNDGFQLPACSLTVAARAQTHAQDSRGRLAQKTYGYYRCRIPRVGAEPERCAIRIYHLTAIRNQVLAPATFTSTLLHEWTHHFDFTGLRLGRSPHTRGFYARLAWLSSCLGQSGPRDPSSE